jgi:energy-converting hydrogenase Eha subunit H
MPDKKTEGEMKMILLVLVVRTIISMVEKNKNITEEKNESRYKIIHPAEFQVR